MNLTILMHNKLIIKILIITISSILIMVFVIYPYLNNILIINHEIVEERLVLENKLERGLNFKEVESNLNEVKSQINQLDNIFIASGDELFFITQIESIAENHNMRVQIASDINRGSSGSLPQPMTLDLNLIGSYQNFIQFMQAVEALPYYYNINQIIASTQTNNDTLSISIKLNGATYIK